MKCLECNSATDVYDTRLLPGQGARRKRKCVKCGFRFATLEVLDTTRELRERTPKPPKPERPQKVRQPKLARSKAVKPRRPEDDLYEPDINVNEDLWDVARELGIEGFK